MQFPLEKRDKISYNIGNEEKAGYFMLKKILLFVLVAAMLSLTSCKIVEVIDHDIIISDGTAEQTEYEPWGYWYSSQTLGAIELVKGSNVAKLYSLAAGYYEYNMVEETIYTYDGMETFTVISGDTTLTFTFDKYANTLTISNIVYTHTNKAPTKHPVYSYPVYADLDIDTYLTIGSIDLVSLVTPILEGAKFEIAQAVYGSQSAIPVAEGIERAVQSGDYVNVDYCGYLDGVAFDGGKAENVPMLISDYQNGYIPGFTDGIIGHTVGETFDVNVTFPENYGATDLAGKAVVFKMTLNSIYNLDLTDDQVAEYEGNDLESYADWIEEIKPSITETVFSDALLEAIEYTETAVPTDIYLYYYQQAIDYLHEIAYYHQMSYEIVLMYSGTSETEILQQSIAEATYNMGLYTFAEKNEITWTQEEFNAEYEGYVTKYLESNKEATHEEACAYADGLIAQMKDTLTEEKVLDWVFDHIFPSAE